MFPLFQLNFSIAQSLCKYLPRKVKKKKKNAAFFHPAKIFTHLTICATNKFVMQRQNIHPLIFGLISFDFALETILSLKSQNFNRKKRDITYCDHENSRIRWLCVNKFKN